LNVNASYQQILSIIKLCLFLIFRKLKEKVNLQLGQDVQEIWVVHRLCKWNRLMKTTTLMIFQELKVFQNNSKQLGPVKMRHNIRQEINR
jgi:hypothetical protein